MFFLSIVTYLSTIWRDQKTKSVRKFFSSPWLARMWQKGGRSQGLDEGFSVRWKEISAPLVRQVTQRQLVWLAVSFEGLCLWRWGASCVQAICPLLSGLWGGGILDRPPQWHKGSFSDNRAVSGSPRVSGVKKRQEHIVASARGCKDSKLNAVKFTSYFNIFISVGSNIQ